MSSNFESTFLADPRDYDDQGFVKSASSKFRKNGFVKCPDVFDIELIDKLRADFNKNYDGFFHEANHENALTVGNKRYQITIKMELPFLDEALYASSAIKPVMTRLLGENHILASVVCVTSLPGAKAQKIHRDHPWLFDNALDRLLPSYAITLIIPLVAMNEQTGMTRVWPGSHNKFVEEENPQNYIDPTLAPGDCMLMDYRMRHQGLENLTTDIRPALFIIYTKPWFRDQVNYGKQNRLEITDEARAQVSREHRHLFDWK